MKTMQLVMAVVSLTAAAGYCVLATHGGSVVAVAGLYAGAAVHAAWGANWLMDSLFGRGGLVCDLFARRVDATNE